QAEQFQDFVFLGSQAHRIAIDCDELLLKVYCQLASSGRRSGGFRLCTFGGFRAVHYIPLRFDCPPSNMQADAKVATGRRAGVRNRRLTLVKMRGLPVGPEHQFRQASSGTRGANASASAAERKSAAAWVASVSTTNPARSC